jgi:tRNA A-37 threonylcarbamoyl transferase component Bud32
MSVILVPYGAKSTISSWFSRYWSEGDRKALPWLCVFFLGIFLFWGPSFLLWLIQYLPADQLGNSGASIFAHQLLVGIAILLAGTTAFFAGKYLFRPTFIELSAAGVALVWKFLAIKVRGRGLHWSDITAINLFQPMNTVDPRNCQLQFVATKRDNSIKIPMALLDEDEGRQAVADAIAKHAINPVEPQVFSELAPKRTISFTEVWLDALSAAPAREKLLPLEEGVILDGRYQIKSRLGSGGQGTVYLAKDNKESTEVVLKESILPVYADLISRRKALEAFHKEAFALESVKHEHIVKFLGSFVNDHRAYLVLAFVPGATLSAVVKKNGPLAGARVKSLALDMCEILTALHGQSPPMVHRDFTPDNLIVGDGERLTLIDFAVSVSAVTPEADAQPEVAGKASYMAPEQFKGRPQTQSDIYSLGATMHFLLTGDTPIPLDESHPIVINELVDKRLSDIVAGATKLDPACRFKNVDELRNALKSLPI